MEVILKGDLLVMKIKITYLILSPLLICYFMPILIFDLDHFFGDLPYLCSKSHVVLGRDPRVVLVSRGSQRSQSSLFTSSDICFRWCNFCILLKTTLFGRFGGALVQSKFLMLMRNGQQSPFC